MSLWLLSQSLPPLCRPSTVEVQRWSKGCHGQCLRERRRAPEQNLAFWLVRAFLGIVRNGFDVTLWGASRLSVGVKC